MVPGTYSQTSEGPTYQILWWWEVVGGGCLNVNLVIGFGPNLGLALWPGAKPIKNKLSSKNILKSSGSWWVPHPIHERVNQRRGRGGGINSIPWISNLEGYFTYIKS